MTENLYLLEWLVGDEAAQDLDILVSTPEFQPLNHGSNNTPSRDAQASFEERPIHYINHFPQKNN